MRKRGFGLIGILIAVALLGLVAVKVYENTDNGSESIIETGTNAIDEAEMLKDQIESRDKEMINNL